MDAQSTSIDWDRFMSVLETVSGYENLTPAQLESLEYMKGYAGYYRRIKKTVPRSLLVCYVNNFPGSVGSQKSVKTGVKK